MNYFKEGGAKFNSNIDLSIHACTSFFLHFCPTLNEAPYSNFYRKINSYIKPSPCLQFAFVYNYITKLKLILKNDQRSTFTNKLMIIETLCLFLRLCDRLVQLS